MAPPRRSSSDDEAEILRTLGGKVQEAREAAGLSLAELARRAGVSRTTVARMETVAKGDMSLKSITLTPEVMQADREMLQDLLLVAIIAALTETRQQVEAKVSSITGGLSIPGLF